MPRLLSLIAAPGSGALATVAILSGEGIWLQAGEAWERTINDDDDASQPYVDTGTPHAFDINRLPVTDSPRRKRLLIADMESTIIEQEMLDELADFVGLRGKISDITERAMRGELDFEAALNERVGLLAGLHVDVLDAVAQRITYMPGARALVATMKAHGAYCALVSGGFTVFTARVAAALGFDEHQANTLEIADGKLTGRVLPPILGRQAKLAALHRLCETLDISADDAIAVGDGANDLAMLEAAGLGVAFRAKPKVREATAAFARGNGAVVTHGDLTGLLYLQGYQRADITHGPSAR